MFAPDAPTDDGVMVIDGVTPSGRHIDPLTHEAPRFEVLPPRGIYPMQPQWCDYSNRIRLSNNSAYRGGLRDYLLHLSTLENRPEERLISFEAYWVSRRTPAHDEREMPPVSKERFVSFP
jgi:hypothetical protein